MIEKINTTYDLKKLKTKELKELAEDIREQIVYVVNKNGGHLSSNLGTVELIISLNKVFNTPKDKIIFDVGHQCYTHKILTGRKKDIGSIRTTNGLSGFINPNESEYDTILAGHSSTSLSQALGMCRARDLMGKNYNVVAVIGDGALTSGMAFEALNDIGNSKTKLIIILNDNEMSIEKNVGAISKHLSKIRVNKNYLCIKKGFRKFIFSIPVIGKPIRKLADKIKKFFLKIFVSRSIFDSFGISYAGTFDGNDISELNKALENAKEMDKPVLLHVYTKKGKGYIPAEENPSLYHSIRKGFKSGQTDYSNNLGKILTEIAEKNQNIIAVTAAMKDGTGLCDFSKKYPNRFFDVGICEQHAVTMCAGMASQGLKPYFCVYSTFLQRGFDQISNDVCIPKLPVTLIIDRAGIVGSDGETHHGLLDVPFLNSLPNMTIYCPKDIQDQTAIIQFSQNYNYPLAIRYENDYQGEFKTHNDIQIGKWEILSPLTEINIISYGGRMLNTATKVKDILEKDGIKVGIINAAFIKPIDKNLIKNLTGVIAVCEESLPNGNLYSNITSYIANNNINLKAFSYCLPDKYITHGKSSDLLEINGLSLQKIAEKIKENIKQITKTNLNNS